MNFCDPKEIIVREDRFRPASQDAVDAMAKSFKEIGQVVPILINNEREKELVHGLHRLLAAMQLGRKVWYVTEADGDLIYDPLLRRVAEYQENFQRREFTPLEKSEATAEIERLMREVYGSRKSGNPAGKTGTAEDDGWSQEDTAAKLGYKSHATISIAKSIAAAAKDEELRPKLAAAKTMAEAANIVKEAAKIEARKELAKRRALRGGDSEIEDPMDFFSKKLLLGNCIEEMKKLPAGICSLFITDPPYGIEHHENQNRMSEGTVKIHSSHCDTAEEILPLIKSCITELARIGKPACQVVMFCAMDHWYKIAEWFTEIGFSVYPKPLLWVKIKKEPFILYTSSNRQADRKLSTSYEAAVYAKRGDVLLAKVGASDTFVHPPTKQDDRFHTAQKPIPLLEEIIERFYHPGTSPLLIDPFAGSASTLIAARRVGIKNYLGFELDPETRERAIAFMVNSYLDDQKESVSALGGIDLGDFE